MMFLRSGNRVKTYELFSGQELVIAEKIQQRRLQILVHSCIYYELNGSTVSDKQWDTWAKELVNLQKQFPHIAEQVIWHSDFVDFDGTTGFNLPIKDEWVMKKAMQIGNVVVKKKVKPVKKAKKGRLF